MQMFLLGVYFTGAISTLFTVGFFCILGGRSKDLWKPFAYALLWPVMLPLFVSGRAS